MLAVGFVMINIDPSSPTKMMLYSLHKSTGVLVLFLVTLRLIWKLINTVPQLPATLKPLHHRLAKLSPLALYFLMFSMPLSGFIMSAAAQYPVTFYNMFTLPNFFSKDLELSHAAALVHKYSAFVFIGVLVLHLSAAFYHHFILKTNILKRMLPTWLVRS